MKKTLLAVCAFTAMLASCSCGGNKTNANCSCQDTCSAESCGKTCDKACDKACVDASQLIGSWVEPIPGMEGQVQGITLEEGGKASSINMSTLVYSAWEQNGKTLILTAVSKGNGGDTEVKDTMNIESLSADSLTLTSGTRVVNYVRQK